jgi:hypothetical protein
MFINLGDKLVQVTLYDLPKDKHVAILIESLRDKPNRLVVDTKTGNKMKRLEQEMLQGIDKTNILLTTLAAVKRDKLKAETEIAELLNKLILL